MSELKPCDFLDNEIFVGDEVAFFALGYRMFTRGTVVKITNKCLFIDYDNSWNYDHHEEHTRQEQRQVIDLTALNRHAQPDNEPLTLDELREMGKTDWVWLTFPELPSEESGWEESRGCNMEVDYARRIGLPIKTIGEDYETEELEENK